VPARAWLADLGKIRGRVVGVADRQDVALVVGYEGLGAVPDRRRDAAGLVRGMALFLSERPEIVITDVFMPEQEGIETILKMRRANPQIKIIAISGGGQIGGVDVLNIARALSADEVIAKPFRAHELLGLIGEPKPTSETEDAVVY
jgi:CheY-like chemotaxis protein